MTDRQLVQNLIVEHLGPIEPLSDELAHRVVDILTRVVYPSGRNIKEALETAGIQITTRQLKPYKDALIMARLGGRNDAEFILARAQANYYPGAQVILK